MSHVKTKSHPAYLGLMTFAVLLSGGFLQAQENLPAEVISPPSLLDEGNLFAVSELASYLSSSGDWMHQNILEKLTHRALRLDEIFADAPQVLVIEGRPYRPEIGPLGQRWLTMDPKSDPFVVFLTAKVYDRLGEGRLLGFQDGAQTVIWPSDFDTLPTLGLDLIADLRTSCHSEVGPSSCNEGKPVCSDPDSEPWYILDSVLKVRYEAKDPSRKTELFPLRPISIASTNNSIGAEASLTGRIAQDIVGRWSFLPDITWNALHEVSGGLDQEWEKPLVDTSSISCSSNSLDESFSRTYTSDHTTWSFRGHVACLDPTCMPGPPATAEMISLKSEHPIWQLKLPTWKESISNPNYLVWIEGYPPGPTCEVVFGPDAVCAELSGLFTQTCCIERSKLETFDPNACLEHVSFVRVPPPPEE